MTDLLSFHARICSIANAVLIHHGKVLLVKHKKLGIWLAPGGHIEPGELPHQTAERECIEETGIEVRAISPVPIIDSEASNYFPVPLYSNLHWVSRENFEARLKNADPSQPHVTPTWPRGCEQHFGYGYLVEPVGLVDMRHDPAESTGIDWFTPYEVKNLQETNEDIKREIELAFNFYLKT